ncbi:MAG: hypothetical protein [Circular genetic element sp.]|nr:MAG: hypothetical protein [Circular genetic element sp.]
MAIQSKIAKKVAPMIAKAIDKSPTLRQAALGAGAVAISETLEDNPYISAVSGAALGFSVAGPVGAVAGGLGGWYMADGERIAPCDLVAIPAYEVALLRQGMAPSFQIFIKEGELITPILPTDAMLNSAVLQAADVAVDAPKRRLSKWQRYMKVKKNKIHFKSGKRKGQLNLKAMGVQYRKGGKK